MRRISCLLLTLILFAPGTQAQQTAQPAVSELNSEQLVERLKTSTGPERGVLEAKLFEQRPATLAALRAQLKSPDEEGQMLACTLLARMRDRESVPDIIRLSYARDPRVQTRAITALRVLGDPRAQARVRELVRGSANKSVLNVSIATLGVVGTHDDIANLLPHLGADDAYVRVLAAAALAMLGDQRSSVAKELIAASHSVDGQVKKTALYGLGYLGTADARVRLAEVVSDTSASWRSYALVAVAQQELIAAPSDSARLDVLARYAVSDSQQVAEWALESLGDIDSAASRQYLRSLQVSDGFSGATAKRIVTERGL